MEQKPGLSKAGKPLFCDMILAHKCFFRCQMCTEWKNSGGTPAISLAECKKFVDQLGEVVDYSLDINIMGGEPLAIDWVLPLCDYIVEKGYNPIISTNAYLIDEKMAKQIADSHLKVLAISLDGINPGTHDAIRGKPGAYEHVMNALDYLNKYRKKDLHLVILPLILHSNLEELIPLVKWIKEKKLVESVSFLALVESGLVNPRENWFRKTEYAGIWPQDPGMTRRVLDQIIDLKKEGYPITNPFSQLEAFKSYYEDPEKFLAETEYCIRDYIVDLDPNGDILLSGHVLGSIKEKTDFKELWFSQKADEIRRYIEVNGCENSRSCLINFVCAFQKDEEVVLSYCLKRAYSYQVAGQYELALHEFKKAVERHPHNGALRLGTAYNYFKLNDYDSAIKEYDEAFRITPASRTAEVIEQYNAIKHIIAARTKK